MESLERSCVIIGGGLAGMVAGRRLQQRGHRPLVLEKGRERGGDCNARISGGMVHIAWAALDTDPDLLYERLVAETSGEISLPLARSLSGAAGKFRSWLHEEGVETRQNSKSTLPWDIVWPPRHSGSRGWLESQPRRIARELGPDLMMTALYTRYLADGGALSQGTRATAIRPATDGTGWLVTCEGRGAAELQTRTVLVADGGFQANSELLCRYVGPHADRCLLRAQPTGTGDGLRMLLSLRAKTVGLGRVYGHMLSATALTDDNLWPYPAMDRLSLKGALIDRQGKLIQHAETTGIGLVNLLASGRDPLGQTVVFDRDVWEQDGTDDPYGSPVPNPALAERHGHLSVATDIGSLAGNLDMSPRLLAESIDAHNHRPGSIQIQSPPYYGARIVPGITFTMGGPLIDSTCAVMSEVDGRIPGIYAAGSAAGGVHGGPRGGYVGGLGVAGTFGLIAGDSISDFLERSTAA